MRSMTFEDENLIRKKIEYKDGVLYWAVRTGGIEKGTEAGYKGRDGYWRVRVAGHRLLSHRLIFFLHYGYFPYQVDHINRVCDDNRIENLRECTDLQNRRNCDYLEPGKTVARNIGWRKDKQKYRVRLRVNGKELHLGHYDDLELAELVASEARNKYYGEWAYDYEKD